MDVRGKTLVIVSGTIILLIIVLSVLSYVMILGNYIQLEDQIARENMYRAEDAIAEQISTIDAVTVDWAAWDDTYEFIEDRNERYARGNIIDGTMENLRLNFMVFVNASGAIVASKAYDLHEEAAMDLPPGLDEHLGSGGPLTLHDSPESVCRGILMLPDGPVLVASRPIVTSNAEGPVRGSLIFGRLLDQAEVERISGMIHHDLNIYAIGDPGLPSGYPPTTATPLGSSVVFVQPVSADAIAGYITPTDIYGEPAFVLRTDMSREIYSQGQASVFFVLISIFGTGLLFGVVTLGVLEKFVLKRLHSLDRDVHRIGARGDLASRVRVEGDDEFAHLATSINGMMNALESTKNNLLEVEQRYHAVVEDQTELISRFLPDGTHVFVNDAYCRYFGVNKEAIVGRRFVPEIPEGDRQRVRDHFAALIPQEPVLAIEHRIRLPDGGIRWQQWTDRAFFDGSGRVVEYQSVGRDVTDRKRAEEELQQAYQRLSDILESLPDGIFVVDKEKRVIAWNHALESMTGVRKQDILHKGEATYAQALYGEKRLILVDLIGISPAEIGPAYEYVTRRGQTLYAEAKIPSLNQGKGGICWIQASPLYDGAGNLIGSIESIRDITERRQAEEAIRVANQKLGILGSITRHDLLNQLTAIRGYVQISREASTQTDVQSYLATADVVSQKMQNLIQFTRDYQNMGIAEPVWQGLKETAMRAAAAAPIDNGVVVDIDDRSLEIYADRLLEKVFYNLFENSVRHGERVSRIHVSAMANGTAAMVVVEDDGVGIPTDEKKKIFYQGYGKNTGYGLFLIREILAITGMTIDETGDPGGGARFEIRLPEGTYRFGARAGT